MKIVFVLGSLQSQRCVKRIRPFIDAGVETVVYAFNRSEEVFNSEIDFPVEIIGSFTNDVPYLKRLPLLWSSFRKIASVDADLYYLFGLDMVLMFNLLCPGKPYVYEESDLVHTYLSSPLVRRVMESLDKRAIRKSRLTLFTSEGFVRYHFGETTPANVRVVPNRLSSSVSDYPLLPKSAHGCLRIGFVGMIRFKTVFAFAETFCRRYPQYEFHFYGAFASERDRLMFSPLKELPNCFFHGSYKSPRDLAAVYSEIDWVLSAYDTAYENVRYAEPNKLYESIYFETPIIVSKGTFLAERVEQWGVGLAVDALDEESVVSLVDGLSEELTREMVDHMRTFPKSSVIDQPASWVDSVLSEIVS